MLKKLGIVSLAGLSMLAVNGVVAAAPVAPVSGAYVEGNLGYGMLNEKWEGATKSRKGGLSGLANVGYQFNKNFALEVGGAWLYDTKFDYGYGVAVQSKQNFFVDAALKGIVPFGDSGVSMFGKVGLAGVHREVVVDGFGTSVEVGSAFRPAALVGAGLSYAINSHFSVNAQANATTKNDSGNVGVPAMFLFTGGVAYHF